MGVQTVDNGKRTETAAQQHATQPHASVPAAPEKSLPAAAPVTAQSQTFRGQADAPSCHYCGSIMTRNGACYRCANCGSTSGCS